MVTAGIVALLITAFKKLIQKLAFIIGKGLCWVVGFLNDVFEMVSGLSFVTYKGGSYPEQKELLKIFFGNSNINIVYWGMALIGIILCIAFTIVAVIRKSADIGEKVKQSIGGIIKNGFKGIVLILLMNFIISSTISLTSVLMDRINYLIINAQSFDLSYDKTYDSDDYATMARILNTVGNYSLNSSYNSRYNLNSCYNDIREDIKHLAEDKKIFDVTYLTEQYDDDGKLVTVNTWQSLIQSIYRSVDDINVPQPLDEYNTKLSDALLEAMDILKNDASLSALERYHIDQHSEQVGEMVALDRMIMLLGTMSGSGGALSRGSGFTDYLRAPYYYGVKDIFNYNQCSRDFSMEFGSWLYITVIIVAFLFAKEMLAMVFNATARIFNMLLLYISAPPFIAVTPLDDGGKLKQWTTAFIIQSLGLFGTIISLRLVMMFLPVVFSGDIQFFESVRPDIFTRVIIMYGAIYTARKASGMIVGILADNAGLQAINAGDVGSEARAAIDVGKGVVGTGLSLGWGALKNDWGIAQWGYGKLTGSKGGGGGSGGGEKGVESKPQGSTPESKLDMGSKSSKVSSLGPNSKGSTGNGGSFETGGSGSARDFETGNRSRLEKVDVPQSGNKTAEDIQTRNRPTLEDPAPGSKSNNGKNNPPANQNPAVNKNKTSKEAPDAKSGLHLDPVDISSANQDLPRSFRDF